MEDNKFLENIDFTENFLTQDQIKCDLILPTQCDSSVDSNESTVQATTTRNCWSNVVQNPYTNNNKYESPTFINPERQKNTYSEKLPVQNSTGTGELKWDIDFDHVPNNELLAITSAAVVEDTKIKQHSSPIRKRNNPYSTKKISSNSTVQNNKKHYRSYNTVSPIARKARLAKNPYASPVVNVTRKINFSNSVSIPTKVKYVPSRDITLPTTARASKKNISVITTNEQKNNICKTVSIKTKVQYVPSLHNIVPTTDRGNNEYA